MIYRLTSISLVAAAYLATAAFSAPADSGETAVPSDIFVNAVGIAASEIPAYVPANNKLLFASAGSEEPNDPKTWTMWFCDGKLKADEYNGQMLKSCSGTCHKWDAQSPGNFRAPGTNCVATSPPGMVKFEVCDRPKTAFNKKSCHTQNAFSPVLDKNNRTCYDVPGTGEISIVAGMA